ncbi:MAG: hypothetical protein SVU32_02660, partial [Candidatus Nanohaloarchaea archaeon]|nr:hypothetical protein [Candidatus Nanohaloarchaea archaeon]
MRRWLLPLLFILLALPVLGLNVTIRDSCNAGEEALFSISNMTNAHAAEPGYYQGFTGPHGQDGKQVCASGVGNTEIVDECDRISNPVLSFYDPGTGVSHLSPKEELNDQVLCARQLATSVWRSCPGGTEPIVSIHSPLQAHVARPGYYDWQICGALFTNATLAYRFTLEGNREFIANFETGANGTIQTTTERPGYVAVQNSSV